MAILIFEELHQQFYFNLTWRRLSKPFLINLIASIFSFLIQNSHFYIPNLNSFLRHTPIVCCTSLLGNTILYSHHAYLKLIHHIFSKTDPFSVFSISVTTIPIWITLTPTGNSFLLIVELTTWGPLTKLFTDPLSHYAMPSTLWGICLRESLNKIKNKYY